MTPSKSKPKAVSPTVKESFLNKKSNQNSKSNNRSKLNISNLEDILNKKWRVFRVSPFYNFSLQKLKFYEKKLNQEINAKKKNALIDFYKSQFIFNKNFILNKQCFEALQVKLIKDESQSAYIGYFISSSNTESDGEGCISFPILLVEAKVHIIHAIHSSLCKIFDCDIQPVTFSFYALISFFVKLLEIPRNTIDISQEQVILEYKVPECEANDKIKISLFLEATTVVFAVIMDALQEKYQDISNIEIIWEFYNKILNHIYHIFKVDLMLAELQKIAFSDAFLTTDGQLKVTSEEAASSALNILEQFTPLDAVTNS